MACFDVKEGVKFFKKLAEYQGHPAANWNSSHPSSDDRHDEMTLAVSADSTFLRVQQLCNELKGDFLYSLTTSVKEELNELLDWINDEK